MTWRGLFGEESTVRQEHHGAGGTLRWVSLVFIGFLGGCQAKADTSPPIRQEDAAKIKAGMTQAEIEAILGPARAATSEQTQRLDGIVATMPEPVRAAQSDKGTDRGWGNSQAWLAARITADGHAWLVTSQFGGAPPPAQPARQRSIFATQASWGHSDE